MKKPFTKDKDWNNKKTNNKRKQKVYLIKKDEEWFNLDDDIDYYNLNIYKDENDFYSKESNTIFILSASFSVKLISISQYQTCSAHFTSNNKLHNHLQIDNCKRNIQLAYKIIISSFLPLLLLILALTLLSTTSKPNI